MGIQKKHLLSVVIVTVLAFQLVNPFIVRADGETTPTPENTPETSVTPVSTEVTVVPEVTSTSVPTEQTAEPVETDTPIPPIESTETPTETPEPTVEPVETNTPIPPIFSTETQTETPEPTGDSAETDTPIPPADSTETPTETSELTPEAVASVAIEEPTVSEILAEIPDGTDLLSLMRLEKPNHSSRKTRWNLSTQVTRSGARENRHPLQGQTAVLHPMPRWRNWCR